MTALLQMPFKSCDCRISQKQLRRVRRPLLSQSIEIAVTMFSIYRTGLILTFCMFEMVSATCWFPDGITADPDGYPCDTSANASQCCRTYEACLSGGACYTQFDSQMYRRSCTDPTFTNVNCPQECKTSKCCDDELSDVLNTVCRDFG